MEVIQPFILPPWEERVQAAFDGQEGKEKDKIKEQPKAGWAVRIATSSSARNDLVGMGGTIRIPISLARAGKIVETFSVTLGTTDEYNPYTAELAAIARGLRYLPEMKYRVIVIVISNRPVAQAIGNPRHQLGQGHIREIYDAMEKLKGDGNRVRLICLPAGGELKIQKTAKMSARQATEPKESYQRERADIRGKSTQLYLANIPGNYMISFHGKKPACWRNRTGMARLNGYLYQIRAAPPDECLCGRSKETVEHFLFRCVKWTTQRKDMMLQCIEEKRGKATSDGQKWTPNIDAIRATIRHRFSRRK
ncbi:hypothetical protein LZL87_014167 [Fusarium oxysporum]|nr:hypothetical protein LZL87_014167 [Fusarium oxysporum]